MQWLVAFSAGVLAAALVMAITQAPGPGLDPDSASYVGAARSFARGDGYRVPIAAWWVADSTAPLSHFPPGYPTAIALPIIARVAPVSSARMVNAVAAFIDVALATLLIARAANLVAAIVAALAILVMRPFVLAHLSILSEPLFLADLMATLVAVVATASAVNDRQQRNRAFLAGCIAALTTLTRYAGIAAGGAVVLWMLILSGTLSVRLRRAGAALLPIVVLVGAWVIRVRVTSGTHGIRTFGIYRGFAETLRMGAATTVAWLVPLSSDQSLPGRRWVALLLLLAIVALIAHATIRMPRIASTARQTILASLVIGVCYTIVISLSRLFADPGIPFDERILIPLFLLATIVVAIALREWWTGAKMPLRIVSIVVVLGWLVASASASYDEAAAALDTGVDFAADEWKLSPLVTWARDSAAHRPIYTNWPPAILFHVERGCHELPAANQSNALQAFADTLRARHGVAIVWNQQNPDFMGPADLLRAPGLRRVAQFTDGSVFTAVP